ncbi:hypothetical protein ACOSP7_030190 [Xanthoceras sorbifolium]
MTSRAAFGKKSKDVEAFISAFKECLAVTAVFNISDLYPSIYLLQRITGIRSQLERIHRTMDNILEDIVNEHKSKKAISKGGDQNDENEDLVDVLLKVQERSNLEVPLTADNVKAVILRREISGFDIPSKVVIIVNAWAISSSYGLANVELALALLLYHFDWKLPNKMKNEDLDMTKASDLAVRRKNELYVIPIPYNSSSTP